MAPATQTQHDDMPHLLGIEFAPLNIPLERRLQTLGILQFFFMTLIFPVFSILIPALLIFSPLFPLALAYFIWLYYDWDAPKKGAYPCKWIMNSRFHKWYADYFPVRLHKTADFSEDKNYLIGYHPHGIISMAAFVNFATNGTGIFEKFPKITFHLCTLVGQFWTPLRREWGLLHGMIDCSKESLTNVLGGQQKGKACVLVVGGAEEALDAHPGHHILTLNKRKGFVKLAITTGSQLVPCYAFGENDIYEQADNPKGSYTRRIQTYLKDVLGFSPPIFHGRGIFNYNFGMLPFRKPLNVVLGAPIPVKKNDSPTVDEVNEMHAKYVKALRDLFEEHKEKFGVSKQTQLVIQ